MTALSFDSPRWLRAVTGLVAGTTLVAGMVVSWDQPPDAAPGVRLHAGVAWVASNKLGQLTLLDGASAEVAAEVQVDRPGSALHAVQQGSTGYALNRDRGSVVRVDGATLESSRSTAPVAKAGDELAVFPTRRAFYTLDTRRGLLATADPTTLKPVGKPRPLDVDPSPDGAVTDSAGRLWVLDERTGDLVWFAGGARRSRAGAATPDGSLLTTTDGRPALLDPGRRTMALLDPETGAVERSADVDLRRDDTVAVSGSPGQRRLLISVSSRGEFLSCTFGGAGSCAEPVSLGSAGAELGKAVEVGNRAVVPDYATGQVSIVDLTRSRVVAQRRLFDRPVRFDLLARDGMVFYNDPDSEQAGVIDLDGEVQPITKYEPVLLGGTGAPDTDVLVGPPGPGDLPGPAGPEPGPTTRPDPRAPVSIVVKPGDHGLVGDEFVLTAVATGGAGITSAHWNFGDGTEATGTTVRHRWDRPGTYPVSVTARLRQGKMASAATQVVVDSPDAPPHIVRIDVAPEVPRVGQQVRFSAELTGGRPQSTAWTVTGDGGTVTTSTEPRFEHVFTAPGSYTAVFTATGGGATVERSRKVTVLPEAGEVVCGNAITSDAVLTKDLLCTGEVGLTIAASDVVLDLAGHTISTDDPLAERKGIVAAAGEPIENITIRNGTVSQFLTGIEMTDVTDVTIDAVTVSGQPVDTTMYGIVGNRAVNVQIRGLIQDGYNPMEFSRGSSVTIVESNITGSMDWGFLSCKDDSTCTVQSSHVQVRYLWCGYTDEGEDYRAAWSLGLMRGVAIEQTGGGCERVSVSHSEVTLLGGLDALSNVLTGNTFSGNTNIFALRPVDISGNQFLGGQYFGIRLTEEARGRIVGNTFSGHGECGIQVLGPGIPIGPLEISENVFEANGLGSEMGAECRDGLRVEGVSEGDEITITGNTAVGNLEYGFNVDPEAVAAGIVVDGGGNTSSGDPKGCRGIICG
jgi:PKD repeat protein